MKEISLNILDIAENSVKAKATLVEITVTETAYTLTLTVKDDGTGMTKDVLLSVTNPFYTTRTTRKVGMGIPLLQFAAEQTGGNIKIESKHFSEYPDEHGTTVTALFYKNHIDFTPLGDVISSVTTLIQGHPETDFLYKHSFSDKTVMLDTREIRAVLEGVPLDTFEVLIWIRDNLREQYDENQ
ncbi:MAG: sensor histidine kinase [Clostridia bacterium]|nr:sensor histidine kinase [Clostridia bacterium]